MPWFIFALLGAIFTASVYTVQKKLLKTASEYIVPFFTYFISSVVLLTISFLIGLPDIKTGFIYALVASIILSCIGLLLHLKAFKITDISLAVPILSLTPLFSILISFLMLGEKISIVGFTGILFIVCGAYLLNFKKSRDILKPFKEFFSNKGLLYMFIVALIFSFVVNVDKMILLKADLFFGWGIVQLTISLVFLIAALIRKEDLKKQLKENLSLILLVGLFATFDTILFGIAFRMQIVPYVIAIKRISVLFSVFYGMVIFKEKNILQRFVAALIMFIGILLIIFSS